MEPEDRPAGATRDAPAGNGTSAGNGNPVGNDRPAEGGTPAGKDGPGGGDGVLTDNQDESRFEMRVGGELAGFLQYHRRGSQLINLIHTEVGEAFQGTGIGGKLARFALDTARREQRNVLPSCPYVRRWIGKHPEYLDLVPEGKRE